MTEHLVFRSVVCTSVALPAHATVELFQEPAVAACRVTVPPEAALVDWVEDSPDKPGRPKEPTIEAASQASPSMSHRSYTAHYCDDQPTKEPTKDKDAAFLLTQTPPRGYRNIEAEKRTFDARHGLPADHRYPQC